MFIFGCEKTDVCPWIDNDSISNDNVLNGTTIIK